MKTKIWKLYKAALISFFCIVLTVGFVFLYKNYYDRLPGSIIMEIKKEQILSYNLPVSGMVYAVEDSRESIDTQSEAVTKLDFGEELTLFASHPQNYIVKTKLFGLIPFKSIDISIIDEVRVIPMGVPVGIYANADGLLVVQTGEFEDAEDNICTPCTKLLFPGDYIQKLNGEILENKYQLVSAIEKCNGESQLLTIKRGEQTVNIEVFPKKNKAGEYKLGIWVKDNIQGIGTLTYLTPGGNFGALGHGIIDTDVQSILNIRSGNLYRAEIMGIKKGQRGTPGEMTGVIFYGQAPLGEIYGNQETGIFGQYDLNKLDYLFDKIEDENIAEGMEIGYKNEISIGKAQMMCTINNVTKLYDITIDRIFYDADNINKSMKITVTDEELIAAAGGIVQGMSGSPIIQNGKLVGAVTHVLVNDPTKGYGIFIENMLEH